MINYYKVKLMQIQISIYVTFINELFIIHLSILIFDVGTLWPPWSNISYLKSNVYSPISFLLVTWEKYSVVYLLNAPMYSLVSL